MNVGGEMMPIVARRVVPEVIDELGSTREDAALSAKQGTVLAGMSGRMMKEKLVLDPNSDSPVLLRPECFIDLGPIEYDFLEFKLDPIIEDGYTNTYVVMLSNKTGETGDPKYIELVWPEELIWAGSYKPTTLPPWGSPTLIVTVYEG